MVSYYGGLIWNTTFIDAAEVIRFDEDGVF